MASQMLAWDQVLWSSGLSYMHAGACTGWSSSCIISNPVPLNELEKQHKGPIYLWAPPPLMMMLATGLVILALAITAIWIVHLQMEDLSPS